MNLQQVFEYLQENKKLQLALPDVYAAHSLRVSLVRKWKKYKDGLSDLGFLDEDTRIMSISMEHGKVMEDGTQEFVFHLRPRSRNQVEYKILNGNADTD